MKFESSPLRGRPVAALHSIHLACLVAFFLASPWLAVAQVPPVDPPAHFTTDNSANWEPGQLLFRQIGLGRVAQAGYLNGNIYAGGYAGRPFTSYQWSNGADPWSLSPDLNEFEGDPIDWVNTQGTHGYPSFGGQHPVCKSRCQ